MGTTGQPPEVPRQYKEDNLSLSSRTKQKQSSPRLDKMSSTTASESSVRIPEMKTNASVSSSTPGSPTGPQTSSLLVSQHPLLCSLLSSPSPQQLVVTPRRQQIQEVGVGGGWRNPE